ncbi:MAG: carbohydrate kinase family protein [Candidatus Komeilibacteria bacterium]
MKCKILCIGGISQDVIFNTSDANIISKKKDNRAQQYIAFNFGSKNSSPSVMRTYGGGALNSAISFISLGIRAVPMSVIGDDFIGQEILLYLKQKKINKKLIKVLPQEQTAFSFIVNLPQANEHVLFFSNEVLSKFRIIESDLRPVLTNWIYLSSLRSIYSPYSIARIFDYAKERAVKVFWNPGQQQIRVFEQYYKYLPQVDFFSINKAEAIGLAKDLKLRGKNETQIAQSLVKLGAKAVLVTDGAKGVNYYDRETHYQQKAKTVKVVNTTGAGDAFNAGFLAGFLHYDQDIQRSLELGINNSAAIIQTMGAHQGSLTIKNLY